MDGTLKTTTMSDSVLIAFIALCGVLLTVVGAILPLFINRWFKQMDAKLDKYHAEINGHMAKLLEGEKAIGNKEGMAEQKAESASLAIQTTEAIKADPDIEVTKNK